MQIKTRQPGKNKETIGEIFARKIGLYLPGNTSIIRALFSTSEERGLFFIAFFQPRLNEITPDRQILSLR